MVLPLHRNNLLIRGTFRHSRDLKFITGHINFDH
jgi:hypothetical protein